MPKDVIAYKVFRVIRQNDEPVIITYPCGHKGCEQHRKAETPTTPRVLKGLHTPNTQLQKAGDAATATGPLRMCRNGWHATPAQHLKSYAPWGEWHDGRKVVFKVRLSGKMLKDTTKICARSIEMLEEIPYKSKAGKALRARIDVLVRRRKARQAAKDKLRADNERRALWKARRAEQREKQAKQRIIEKALRKLRTTQRKAQMALLKKLRSK